MFPQALAEPQLPTAPLAVQHPISGWALGPANRIGSERESRTGIVLGCVLAQGNDEIHVLGDGIRAEPAHLHDGFMLKEGEGPRDNDSASQQRPAVAACKEAAQVLDHLKALKESARQSQFHYLAIASGTSINNPHDTAADDDLPGRAEDGLHQPQEANRAPGCNPRPGSRNKAIGRD